MRLPAACLSGLAAAVVIAAGWTTWCTAQEQKADPNLTITDPAKAGPDFAIQGEYLGEDEEGNKHGAQVIALGGGKFEIVHYMGGLPGDGWKRGDRRHKGQGELNDDGSASFKGEEGWLATIRDGKLTATSAEGKVYGTLKKIERKSPTLGAEPPKSAIVLFDGSPADAFENGKLSPDGFLEANCTSKQKFGDCVIHLEFRTPFKPYARGQARGNSGVYAQSRYEIQVLDSFGLEGKDNECGGIYSASEPAVNMCFPPLSWQTYDIEFTQARYENGKKVKNARITVKHNGVVIHKDLELPKATPGKAGEGPEPLGWYLQGHGNPVVYRNIWVVEK